ncbi:metal-dependent hydrolase [Skermanella mucosa]|uniref:metal-dependent hydrolase n=1 Tax=Skermanella mucosa TaxID=1789672 RepID=UPI00192B7B2A|nr:metal-dependent hydrolase [Skermanella mucosa]UEM23353.1 metal-dependent hydrolase [Skermanella mucosa]
MMAGSHALIGSASWLYLAHGMGLPLFDPVALGLAVAGSLGPDIDHPKSWVGRRLKFISVPLSKLFGHRGLTHSIVAVAGCVAVLRWDGQQWHHTLPFVIGYASHLAADLITPAGLCLAWPLKRTFAFPLIRTGSFAEQALVTVVAGWLFAQALGSCG